MPNLGDRIKGREIGREKNNARGWFVWWECPKCKRQSWKSEYWLARSSTGLCIHCIPHNGLGAETPNWKGGRHKSRGYVLIKVYPDNPFYAMADPLGYIPEHRLVMAQYLGRCLKRTELVHHLNGIRNNNGKENLAIVNRHNHEHNTLLKLLQARIRELEQLHLRI